MDRLGVEGRILEAVRRQRGRVGAAGKYRNAIARELESFGPKNLIGHKKPLAFSSRTRYQEAVQTFSYSCETPRPAGRLVLRGLQCALAHRAQVADPHAQQ